MLGAGSNRMERGGEKGGENTPARVPSVGECDLTSRAISFAISCSFSDPSAHTAYRLFFSHCYFLFFVPFSFLSFFYLYFFVVVVITLVVDVSLFLPFAHTRGGSPSSIFKSHNINSISPTYNHSNPPLVSIR